MYLSCSNTFSFPDFPSFDKGAHCAQLHTETPARQIFIIVDLQHYAPKQTFFTFAQEHGKILTLHEAAKAADAPARLAVMQLIVLHGDRVHGMVI